MSRCPLEIALVQNTAMWSCDGEPGLLATSGDTSSPSAKVLEYHFGLLSFGAGGMGEPLQLTATKSFGVCPYRTQGTENLSGRS